MKNNLYIGIDVGGTKISAGVVTAKGKILHWEKCPTPQRAQARTIYNTILKTITDLLKAENLHPQSISGIGLGIPGIVNPQTQQILATPNIDLAGFPLSQELGKKFPVPICMDNDVNVGLLGEQWLGAAQNTKNVVGLFPGTGIGGAIIINDKLFPGSHGAAAELGHMLMDPDGPLCSCGNRGCLEALASRWAIERDIREAIKNKKVSPVEDFIRVNRGQFIKIEALVSNLSMASSAPFSIGIYLSNYRDGRDKVHEFDVIPGVSLSESEQIPVSGQYLIPYSIDAGRSYWVVVEADYDRNVSKKDEKDRRMIKSIFVPCDEFAIDYPDYLCTNPGEND